jgi:uncharacterized protein YaaR (DUF327 family)
MMLYEVRQALDHTIKQIDEKVKQLEEALGAKSAKTYDEYCGMCGEITGLLTARRYITDLTKNMENSDE